MDPRRLLPIVVLGEGLLLATALAIAWSSHLALPLGHPVAGVGWGLFVAVALGVLNLGFLRTQTAGWPGRALRYVCRVIVRPLFEHVRMWHIVVISMLAGIGEELLFRGVLQPLIGLPLASLIFGAVHVGGRAFIGYGVWAACIGAVFGWLTFATGGLLAPIVAHAVYDMLALAYVRYGPTDIYAIELDSNAS